MSDHDHDQCVCGAVEKQPQDHPNFPAWVQAARELEAQGKSIGPFNGEAVPVVLGEGAGEGEAGNGENQS